MQRRVARHHGLDAIDVVGVDSLLELPDLLQGVDVSLELRPARKPVETRDLELRIGDRRRGAGLEQVLGLVLQMAEIGAVGKRAWCLWVIDRHGDLLSSKRPLSAHRAERRWRRLDADRWASTLSADRMRPLREGNPIVLLRDPPSPSRVKGILFSFSGLTPLTPALSPRAGRGREFRTGPRTQGSACAPPWATNISPLAGLGQNSQPF